MRRRQVVIGFFGLFTFTGCSSGGRCDYPDDRAKDGSRCGARSAQSRPGGRNPDGNRLLWTLGALGLVAYFLTR
jgi:hypothetical protein